MRHRVTNTKEVPNAIGIGYPDRLARRGRRKIPAAENGGAVDIESAALIAADKAADSFTIPAAPPRRPHRSAAGAIGSIRSVRAFCSRKSARAAFIRYPADNHRRTGVDRAVPVRNNR